jgi:Ca-activated chloride channel family protein
MGVARQPVGEGAVTFARPDLLLLAPIAPVALVVALWLYARRRRAVALALGEPALIARLGGAELLRFPVRRLALVAAAGLVLALAAAGPRWGTRAVEGETASRSVVLALDVSKSMLAEDIEPNRLERQRLFVRRLIRELAGDRIGMVVFAGRAYVLAPLTVDHSALHLFLDALDPGIVSQGGSSLAAALTQATILARGANEIAGDRAVLLVSDGEALENEALVHEAADAAASSNVTVFTVGIGTTSGAPVPEIDPRTGRVSGYKRDEDGETVVSRLNASLLNEVARRTGGTYVSMSGGDVTGQIVAALGAVQRSPNAPAARQLQPRERYGLFAAFALLLLALDALAPGLAGTLARLRAHRASPALRAAGLTALVLTLAGAGIGDVERGNRLYRAGRYAEAVGAYEAALRAGDTSFELRYNIGTALLQLGRYTEAEQHFRAALDAVQPELRQRTFYNLGNRFLDAARRDPSAARALPLLGAAVDAYQRSLRLGPDDRDAKWNLELALREQQRAQQRLQDTQGGGPEQPRQQQSGAGQGQPEPEAGDAETTRRTSAQRIPLTREQAERILSAVEQDERELTRRTLRRGQRRTAVQRDW